MNTTARSKPARVSHTNPCPVCGKDRWCMIGDAYIVCMRVQSDRPKEMADGQIGWLHPVGSAPPPRPVREEKPVPHLNVGELLSTWTGNGMNPRLDRLASSLGVTTQSLEWLNCVKAPYHETWAFPMRYGDGSYSGIRLRNIKGEKWAERGSHQGLFIPQSEPSPVVLVVEGPTDCAAALSIGYFAIGRPNCCGGVDQLKLAIKKYQIRRAVIVTDLDDPGLRGAKTLAEHLLIPSAILTCPAKDMRAFVNNGGNKVMLDAIISTLVWRQPNA